MINIRLGGDGNVRDDLAMAAALGAAYAMVWNRRTERWELDVADPVDRAVLVLEALIRSVPFVRANTATALAITAMILADAGKVLTLDADRASKWAEQAAELRSTLWLRTWLEPWIEDLEPGDIDGQAGLA